MTWPSTATTAFGVNDDDSLVKVQIQGPKDSLGIQINNVGGHVVIQKVIVPKDPKLMVGMRLQGYSSTEDLMARLATGPYPITLEFMRIDGVTTSKDTGMTTVTEEIPSRLSPLEYTKRILQESPGPSVIRTRRDDLLEIEYEAKYIPAAGASPTLYDSSAFRGTGQPYQMVLGSGDMIPGVDLGLTNMCPGEVRQLIIPPTLAYGPRARENFKIPIDYRGLEWTIKLVSIDGVIRADNNNLTREQREANYSE